jgi:hypothetical protein
MSETQPVEERKPANLTEVLADLQGFGIEECEEILTIESGNRIIRFKFANISSEDDLEANLQLDQAKGYDYFQRIKIVILAKAISWINGLDLSTLDGPARLVTDPKTGEKIDFRVMLRRTITSWGSEVMQALWKMLTVHMQKIEDRLLESLPETAVTTEVERRYKERIEREFDEATKDVLAKRITELVDGAPTEEISEAE